MTLQRRVHQVSHTTSRAFRKSGAISYYQGALPPKSYYLSDLTPVMGEWSSDPTSSTEEVTVGLRRYLKFTWLYPHLKSVVPLCTTMWVEHHFPLLNHLTVWQNHSEAVWKSFSSLNSSHPRFCFSHLLSHVCLACPYPSAATKVAQTNQVFYSSIALFTFGVHHWLRDYHHNRHQPLCTCKWMLHPWD